MSIGPDFNNLPEDGPQEPEEGSQQDPAPVADLPSFRDISRHLIMDDQGRIRSKRHQARELPDVLKTMTGNSLRIVTNIYHRIDREEPLHTFYTSREQLSSEDQPLPNRRQTATPEWEPLPLYFFQENVGRVVIENIEGIQHKVRPSEEEQKRIAEAALELSWDRTNSILIPNGGHQILLTNNTQGLFIRCANGSCLYRLSLYPA